MDKQRSEHIENRFRQAAENFLPPPPTDEAWSKMEALLDKDPKKRRLFIWWWWAVGLLVLLMLGAGGGYIYTRNATKPSGGASDASHPSLSEASTGATTGSSAQSTPAESKENRVSGTAVKPEENDKSAKIAASKTDNPDASNPTKGLAAVTPQKGAPATGRVKQSNNPTESVGTVSNYNRQKGSGKSRAFSSRREAQAVPSLSKPATSEALVIDEATSEMDVKAFTRLPSAEHGLVNVVVLIPDSTSKLTKGQPALTDSLQKAIDAVAKSDKGHGLKPLRFYVAMSGSKSSTNLRKFDTKNWENEFGGDAGIHVTNWLSVQAGFHASRRIYTAGPGDYKFASRYWDTMRIGKIDANCLIFELPLSLRFDFLRHRTNSLYAVAGMSSYLMNTENYKYHYFAPSGTYYYGSRRYVGDLDFFSSVNLSVGYEQRVFKSFFLQVEPYARLPISGIGAGYIKLYSLGLQLGIKFDPHKIR